MRRSKQRADRRSRSGTARLGVVGTVLLVALMVVAYRFDQLPFVASDRVITAEFAEIGTLRAGDDVLVSGTRVGEVRSVEIDGQHVDVEFRVDETDLLIGNQSRARVVTTTLLGQAALEVRPEGEGNIGRGDVIDLARTSSPYDITQALAQLTTEVDEIDVDQLSSSVSTIADVFAESPEDLRATVDGVTALSGVLAANDEALSRLLARAQEVTGVLAGRDAQVATLLQSGDQLLAQLADRRDVVVQLLASTEALAAQLSALVTENSTVLTSALTEVQGVLDLLNENRENLDAAITGLTGYATEFGEAVSTGPFFDAYVSNLTEPGTLMPVLSGILEDLVP